MRRSRTALIGIAAAAVGLVAALAAALPAAAVVTAAPSAAAAAVSRTLAEPAASVIGGVSSGLDDFTFDSFDAVYELSRDDGGRSVLDATETLVARFPEFDQNRGIRRAIPSSYRGHPTDIEQITVSDGTGAPRSFEVEESDDDDDGDFLYVTIRADDFVHGEQTYVISYRQHNVTLQPDDANVDEFYWDVNGTGWAQPFGRVSAELHLSDDLEAARTGAVACYRGAEGSSTPCDSLQEESQPPVITAEALDLLPLETLTLALAFDADTFVPRDEAFGSSPAAVGGAVAAVIAVLSAAAALFLRLTRWRDHPGRGTIIAQYEPPPGVSTLAAADLVGASAKGVTATILERAVAGQLRIVESGRRKYAVEYVGGGAPADPDADAVVSALFRDRRAGERRELANDTALGKRLYAINQAIGKRVVASGLRRRPALGLRVLLLVIAGVAAILSFVLGVIALDAQMGGFWPAVCFGIAFLAAVLTLVAVASVRPLTEQGRELRDHLEGLRLYIRLAEADRLRVLQSPSGALRVERPAASDAAAATDAAGAPVSTVALDPVTVLKLNERLLPYAVLFGLEREWAEVLSALHEQVGTEPSWYSGSSGFNAGVLASGISSFSSASSSSWSGSASSSGSSGSGGGGSAGGGGGGGGGGGV
ncbi:putative membrane protein YgcG/major membrane immunogen (membrane-anchored lipoprotein) [Agromyces hippuratus]|uniref:Putative membrane protein YgcG/major membrane immunogen (Membrane-anchored lipoprotein) n=1 Tax=Agromyces hippuratus TaxID=286438 RepID=A0A852WNE8_9MICO|nr:DUF2207 domain-containing protein [Agromyces hippuratus]NYG19449.1 putative membrane protein YgcG/major membrane immunogen (membrane-anchored lipoprotein) [Agromyces hippuratus]